MSTIQWPWAIILCRFSDKPAEPQQPQYYVDLYTQNGTGGIADYWRAVSSNALDLTGSAVFGWLTMTHPSSDVYTLTFPGDRWKLVQWGIDAARAANINLTPFRAILVVHNFGIDHGFAGNGVVIVHGTPTLCEFGFICHEMGHGMGLPHSWSANPDQEYGDGWDVMSFATTTFQFPITFEGTQGAATVGINARNLDALGATPPSRVWQPTGPDFSASLTLDPLSQMPLGNHGPLVARIPPSATNPPRPSQSTYTIEYRHQAGWDQGIPEDSVSIREIRSNSLSYLQPSIWGRFRVGDQFVTTDPKVFVRVTAINSTAATAAIRIWDLPDGCLRKEDSKPKVYLIQNQAKRWVTSPAVLFALGKSWSDVRSVPDGGLMGVPNGPDVLMLAISLSPHPPPVNRLVQLTVHAEDVNTHLPVSGTVTFDGLVVGHTDVAFSHMFRANRVFDPEIKKWVEGDVIVPDGNVTAPGYEVASIDFGL
jgi:hypothetical protein